jgi:hypothetical protein
MALLDLTRPETQLDNYAGSVVIYAHQSNVFFPPISLISIGAIPRPEGESQNSRMKVAINKCYPVKNGGLTK